MDNYEDQQDLQQEIIYQLWKAYPSFRNDSQFSTWMYRVAVNTAIVFFRKKKKRPVTVASDDLFEKADSSEHEEKENKLNLFYKAVQQLDNIEKALIFYQLEGFSGKEIAQSLGISEVNVRVKLNRVKNKIKETIKNWGHEF